MKGNLSEIEVFTAVMHEDEMEAKRLLRQMSEDRRELLLIAAENLADCILDTQSEEEFEE